MMHQFSLPSIYAEKMKNTITDFCVNVYNSFIHNNSKIETICQQINLWVSSENELLRAIKKEQPTDI